MQKRPTTQRVGRPVAALALAAVAFALPVVALSSQPFATPSGASSSQTVLADLCLGNRCPK